MPELPTEDELRSRIERHMARRPGADTVVQTWTGYLAGLLEWGLIDADAYRRLGALMPVPQDTRAVVEIALGDGADGLSKAVAHSADRAA